MGRRLFLSHLEEVAVAPPTGVSGIHSPDEGLTAFIFSYTKADQPCSCNLKLLMTDVDEYPEGNTYMLFTDDETADQNITNTLDTMTAVLIGQPLANALIEISRSLLSAVTHGQASNPIALDVSDPVEQEEEEDFEDEFLDYDSDDDFGFDIPSTRPASTTGLGAASGSHQRTSLGGVADLQKIRSDLRATKQAGFRVGTHGDLLTGGIVCVSIRVTRLGISEEAMQAWGLRRSHYLALMIRFPRGYRDLRQVRADAVLSGQTEMRVALCEHYKPSREAAFEAFGHVHAVKTEEGAALEALFIGSPLNELLRDRFSRILKFRESYGSNWPSAEAFVYGVQGKAVSAVDHLAVDDYMLPDDTSGKALPDIVKADAADGQNLTNVSLPLVAMQFVLRHFVRCTEFCLVCHCKVEDTFEALKPYVCSRPLCLYQYMALGFGPSIEWEVLSQPYVVDLLVSFCYSAAKQGRLKEFPVGIDLKVPMLPHYSNNLAYRSYYQHNTSSSKAKAKTYACTFAAKIDHRSNELVLETDQQQQIASLRVGDWMVICSKDNTTDSHYRVEGIVFPVIKLGNPVHTNGAVKSNVVVEDIRALAKHPAAQSTARPSTPPGATPSATDAVECYCYDSRFDEISSTEQQHAISLLLDVLPRVTDMQQYLQQQVGHEASLKTWRDRLPEPALNLLRWIIASNRSCIMQVDHLAQDKKSVSMMGPTNDDRVGGMDEWMQFRFAQGAPDKEQRFIDAVNRESSGKQYPTFFAWHGSPIGNWHSIIRQGLRYDETLHGRAYGNGVYMSHQALTSLGYSNMHHGDGSMTWPGSALKITNALSLQEVVNVPDQFVARYPHYVVSDIDWVQTRYLFVKTELKHINNNTGSAMEYVQDPKMAALGESGKAVRVPTTVVSKSRRPATGQASSKHGSKKSKTTTMIDQATAEQLEDDANSVVSDEEDLALLTTDGEDSDEMSIDEDYSGGFQGALQTTDSTTSSKKRPLDAGETDFQPGTVDVSNIKFLPPPADATPSATKALMGAFKESLKVQESTPLHKLGWYIDPDYIENVYQWIVELHSFNHTLPLATDMKKADISSIVLEMRFTNQFPFAPPFIRVVKPRFLPFNQGGGGHVTEGGAICMELLTNTGWSAVTSIESVLLQVQLAMCDEERPARLIQKNKGHAGGRGDSYEVGEAVAAYERACRAHGWQIPEGFSQFAMTQTGGPHL
ncbi:uncharacterized protein HMPREF1541_03384 [Cyphellophora europaea CBS 101466]|uniref:UBC core domain-containing protein n=1 Tax=Cyphellophora europaea (strain CBS 101466) TaxID=1220924 RepID=W2S0A0_CYPE1|nr:uncharacterized protein HMPREF1541_03384 [Cyphellophora europaea CBS 101466]ETN41448.1 hypothetical protein HMPREF1541_03384 [Cyphellophora europaea CBS 101466]